LTEVQKITNQINRYEDKIKQLKDVRKSICPHDHIKKDCYCDDEYAQCKTYTYSYKCLDCGLYGSSNSWDFAVDREESLINYKLLEPLY
jgi:hypothetical protein